MPGIDNFSFLAGVTERFAKDTFLPVLAVGPLVRSETRERAFRAGAKDFLSKPIDVEEFCCTSTRSLTRALLT